MTNEAERHRWNDDVWAAAWPKREQLTDNVTPFLLAALELGAGERILDIGCGGGKAALAAAVQVGPAGQVVAADISEPLLALAERRTLAAGATNVSFVHADAQVDRLGDGGYDAAMSQFGVMFFDEPVTAFSNVRAHLRPGGRLAFACWLPIPRNPWFVGGALAVYAPTPPPLAPGKSRVGPFTLAEPDQVASTLAAAGFSDVACTPHEFVVSTDQHAVFDDVQLTLMGIVGPVVEEARRAARDHLRQLAQPDGRLRFPIAFQIVTATNGTR